MDSRRAPAGVRDLLPLSELPYINGRYDRVVSVIGNSDFHVAMFKYHQRYGGVCLAHDPHLADYHRLINAWLDDAHLSVEKIVTNIEMQTIKEFRGFPLPNRK